MNRNNKNNLESESGSSGVRNSDKLDLMIGRLVVPTRKSKEQAWQSILGKIERYPEAKTIPLLQVALQVAASFILMVTLGGSIWIWGFSEVTIYCPKGQHITAILPDSSQIKLNADTRIAYNKALWYANRKVYINGEALFNVKKGKQFDVVADIATTSVLGTTFDVYARNEKVKVSCIEGCVSVKNNSSNDKVILTAGHNTQATHNKIASPAESIKNDDVSWSSGEFFFNKIKLEEVLDEIERQFNVEIIYSSTEQRFYTGYFNNKDLNDALMLVCIPMNVNFTMTEKTIKIK